MLQAILLDLDNTLLLFDEHRFYTRYMALMYRHFADTLAQQEFVGRVSTAMQQMVVDQSMTGEAVRSDATQHSAGMQHHSTNGVRFATYFGHGLPLSLQEVLRRFETAFAADYDQLRDLMTVVTGLPALFRTLDSLQVRLVIASQPVLPLAVQQKRIEWAGLAEIPFELITHMDNMHAVKPRVEYYAEICAQLAVEPTHCLMVGDDPVNDMVSRALGMHTYLTTDKGVSGRQQGAVSREFAGTATVHYEPEGSGPLHALPHFIERLYTSAE